MVDMCDKLLSAVKHEEVQCYRMCTVLLRLPKAAVIRKFTELVWLNISNNELIGANLSKRE